MSGGVILGLKVSKRKPMGTEVGWRAASGILQSMVRLPKVESWQPQSWEPPAELALGWLSERQLILRMECKATVQQPRSRELML